MSNLPFQPFTIGRDTTSAGSDSFPHAKLLLVGDNANALYSASLKPLAISRIGDIKDFGVGETAPRGVIKHKDKYYMLGQTKKALYEMLQTDSGDLTGEAKFLAYVNIANAVLQNLASDGEHLVMTANIVQDGVTTLASNIYNVSFGASETDVHFTEIFSFDLEAENQIRGIAYFDTKWRVIGRKSKALWEVSLDFTTPANSTAIQSFTFGNVVTEPQSISEFLGELLLTGNGELYTVDVDKRNLLRNTNIPKGFGFNEMNVYGLSSTKPQEITITSQETLKYGDTSIDIEDTNRVAFKFDAENDVLVPFKDAVAGETFDILDYYTKVEADDVITTAVEGIDTFSGEYSDLNGRPTLFDGAYDSLTGKPDIYSKTEANNEFRTSTQVDFQIDEKITALNLPMSSVITTTDKLTTALANRATTEYVDEKIQEVNRREDDRDPFDSALYYTMGQTDTAIETAINAIPVRDINWTDLKNVPADITSRNANTLDSHDSSYFATQTEFDNLSATVNGLNNFDGQYSSLSGLPTIPDVSNFRTSSQIDTQINSALTVYYTKTEANNTFTTADSVDMKLQSYYTKVEVDGLIPAVPVQNIVGGTNVTVSHENGVFTINSSGGGGTTTPADGNSYIDDITFVNYTLNISQTEKDDVTEDLSSLRDGLATTSALNALSTTVNGKSSVNYSNNFLVITNSNSANSANVQLFDGQYDSLSGTPTITDTFVETATLTNNRLSINQNNGKSPVVVDLTSLAGGGGGSTGTPLNVLQKHAPNTNPDSDDGADYQSAITITDDEISKYQQITFTFRRNAGDSRLDDATLPLGQATAIEIDHQAEDTPIVLSAYTGSGGQTLTSSTIPAIDGVWLIPKAQQGESGSDSTVPGPQGVQGRYEVSLYREIPNGDTAPSTPVARFNAEGAITTVDGTFLDNNAPGLWHSVPKTVDHTTYDYYRAIYIYDPANPPVANTDITFNGVIRADGDVGADSTVPGPPGPVGPAGSDDVSYSEGTLTIGDTTHNLVEDLVGLNIDSSAPVNSASTLGQFGPGVNNYTFTGIPTTARGVLLDVGQSSSRAGARIQPTIVMFERYQSDAVIAGENAGAGYIIFQSFEGGTFTFRVGGAEIFIALAGVIT